MPLSDQSNCEVEDRSVAVELTYKELLAITDAFAFSAERSRLVHGGRFVTDLHYRLTQRREAIAK